MPMSTLPTVNQPTMSSRASTMNVPSSNEKRTSRVLWHSTVEGVDVTPVPLLTVTP